MPTTASLRVLSRLVLRRRILQWAYKVLKLINAKLFSLEQFVTNEAQIYEGKISTNLPSDNRSNEASNLICFQRTKINYPSGLILVERRFPQIAFTQPTIFNLPKYFLYGCFLLSRAGKRAADGIYITMPFYQNYYHWLIEIFPRLALLREELSEQELPVILPADLPMFARECIEMILPPARMRYLPLGTWRCDTMLFPPRIAPYGTITSAQVEALKTAVLPEFNAVGARKRIYVSRDDAAIRRVVNESELRPVFSKYDFEVVLLVGKSVAEQARLFASADVVVAPHGAGLANVAFAQRGATLIEVVRMDQRYSCYKPLAEAAEIKYHRLFAEMRGYDLHLDPAILDATLANVLGEARVR